MLMGAASVNLPAIALSVGPMLNGYYLGNCVGSGSIIWDARRKLSGGEINKEEFMELAAGSSPSVGHCNTMGTALTMNCLTEALGLTLPGCASIPAPFRERQQMAYLTGKRCVELVMEDLTPSNVFSRKAFENAIAVCAAIGGSTNAPIHINAIARHANVPLSMSDWQETGHHVPLLVNCQPTGEFLSEDFHRAGGLPAVISEMLKAGLLNDDQITVNGKNIWVKTMTTVIIVDAKVIKTVREPILSDAGFMVLTGNLFESAILKVSAINQSFRDEYLSDSENPGVLQGDAVVFEGPEDYHERINDPSLGISKNSILIMRGAGPVAYPGSAEVVNMQPPDTLIQAGYPCLAHHR